MKNTELLGHNDARDVNIYVAGHVWTYSIAIACLLAGVHMIQIMPRTSPWLCFGFAIDIKGMIRHPDQGFDVCFGDVVVNHRYGQHGGVVYSSKGKSND